MRDDKPNLIVDLTFEFAKAVVLFCEELKDKKQYLLVKQLFRSGTSIGANVREAQNAESKPDFIHKMKIASKEADETEYWLMLCRDTGIAPSAGELLEKVASITRVLSKIIASSKSSSNSQISKSSNQS